MRKETQSPTPWDIYLLMLLRAQRERRGEPGAWTPSAVLLLVYKACLFFSLPTPPLSLSPFLFFSFLLFFFFFLTSTEFSPIGLMIVEMLQFESYALKSLPYAILRNESIGEAHFSLIKILIYLRCRKNWHAHMT